MHQPVISVKIIRFLPWFSAWFSGLFLIPSLFLRMQLVLIDSSDALDPWLLQAKPSARIRIVGHEWSRLSR
jgi:hypothetical protein